MADREELPHVQKRSAGPAGSTTTNGTRSRPNLTVVFAALAVSRLIERSTGWSIARFVKTLRRYHTVTSQAGDQTITAADPLPEERYELSPSCALPPKHADWHKSGKDVDLEISLLLSDSQLGAGQ
jgi:hypothetical protein